MPDPPTFDQLCYRLIDSIMASVHFKSDATSDSVWVPPTYEEVIRNQQHAMALSKRMAE